MSEIYQVHPIIQHTIICPNLSLFFEVRRHHAGTFLTTMLETD